MKKKLKTKILSCFLCIAIIGGSISFKSTTVNAAPTSNLTLKSSSKYLEDSFNWSKNMALSLVKTGIGSNIPSYQAALQNRNVFCQRDYAHQVDGAHILGLDTENYSMLNAFAKLQTYSRMWYSPWELNYDGSISSIDYSSDTNFWRCIPGMFELVETGYRQYQWTGNSNLINDNLLFNFYGKVVNDFVSTHDENKNGIAEEHSSSGWQGLASYNEGPDYTLAESADGLASQYQAFIAYSKILKGRGDRVGAEAWNQKAINLKNTFNTNWYSSTDKRFIRGFTTSNYSPVTNFGYESSWFIPYKEISNEGTRATDYLNFIDSNFLAKPSSNIEAWSYLPDLFYKWGDNDKAWNYLKRTMDTKSDYPEISFTAISAITTGMMGIRPDAPENKVSTLPRLPYGNPSEIAFLELNNLMIGNNNIKVRHDGNGKTTLTLNSGREGFNWEACFEGDYSRLMVNGVSQDAHTKSVNGKTISYVTITLNPGDSVVVDTSAIIPQQYNDANLIKNLSFEKGTSNWTFTSGTGASSGFSHTGSNRGWLNPGASNKISQTIISVGTGTYDLSAWVAAAGNGGVLGVKVNDVILESINIPNNSKYNLQSISNITVNKGDNIEIYVTGPTSNWVNIDDVTLVPSSYKNLISNSGFEYGTSNWTFTNGTGSSAGLCNTGANRGWLNPNTGYKISQNVTIETKGNYYLAAYVAAEGNGGVLGVKVNGDTRATAPIISNPIYNLQIISDINLNPGDVVEVYVSGPTSKWINVDDVEFVKFLN